MWTRKMLYPMTALMLLSGVVGGQEIGMGGEYKLSGPYTFKNLTLFLIHATDGVKGDNLQTLEEALQNKSVIMHETGEVGELEVENLSDIPVFIQAGDIVKGGRQDRMLRIDFVVVPKSGKQPIASFCVEQGRWSQRGKESAVLFETSSNVVAHKDIKVAALSEESQQNVWNRVADVREKFAPYIQGVRAGEVQYIIDGEPLATSLQLTQENKEVQISAKLYIDSLGPQINRVTDAVGIVAVVNGEISSADIYRSVGLFEKLKDKLLNASALEALAEQANDKQQNSVTADTVQEWLVAIDSGRASVRVFCSGMHVTKKETEKEVGFESRVDSLSSAWIHKSVISK
jgi:hypothetical protein